MCVTEPGSFLQAKNIARNMSSPLLENNALIKLATWSRPFTKLVLKSFNKFK